MEILGVGPSELIFIILIAIIVLGPRDMQKAGRMIGHWLNRLTKSEGWKMMQDTSRDLRDLPNKLMRDANMEIWEAEKDLRRTIDPRSGAPPSPTRDTPSAQPEENPPPSEGAENSTQSAPPSVDPSTTNSEEKPGTPSGEND